MNKTQINEMISKQVEKQITKSQKQNLFITGIGVIGVGVISIITNHKMLKEQHDQVENFADIISSRDEDYKEVLSAVTQSMLERDAEREELIRDINANLKKQTEIFDRMNFVFEQQDAYYDEDEKAESSAPENETLESNK